MMLTLLTGARVFKISLLSPGVRPASSPASPWTRLFSTGGVEKKAKKGKPLLNIACRRGNVEVAKLLLDGGVSPDGAEGAISPLEIACVEFNVPLANLLFENGRQSHEGD